ncbi:Atg32 [Kluyveromyces lactis]|nr:Atg32 [Kluyveromyces lactis]
MSGSKGVWGAPPGNNNRQLYSLDAGSSGSGVSASSAQRHSILDPHDSVMDLLNGQQSRAFDTRLIQNHDLIDRMDKSNNIDHNDINTHTHSKGLTDSWQAIDRDEYSFLNAGNYNNYHNTSNGDFNQQFGGVLSSDTSEEEVEINAAPSPNLSASQQHNQFVTYPLSSTGFGDQGNSETTVHQFPAGDQGKSTKPGQFSKAELGTGTGDDETIMVNLGHSWAGSFFVMPKLSLSESMKRFKILILSDGDSANSFYNRLSRYHRLMFDVGKINEVSKEEALKYTAFMIIFSDSKKVNTILNRMWKKYGDFTLIPICQKGQKQSVTEKVKTFANSNKIKLMSYPVVISDHYEIHGLLRHLHSLYVEVDSDYETDVPKKTKPRKGAKKKPAPHLAKRWWFWPISIALGVGIGCCVTFYFGKFETFSYNSSVGVIQTADKEIDAIVDVIEGNSPSILEESPPQSISDFLGQVCKLIKDTAIQFNELLKQFLSAHLMTSAWIKSIGKEFMQPDSQSTISKVTALDLVMF